MGKTVLVTGAGGFIGSHLTERLVRDGHEVRALVRYNGRDDRGHLDRLPADVQGAIEVHRGDLKDPEAVRKAVEGREWVFHLGALIAIPYSYQNPLRRGADQRARHRPRARRLPGEPALERVVLTSTSEVYGTARYVPIDETAPAPGPVAVRGDQDRRRRAGRELSPGLRPAGDDPAAVQHVRPAAVGPRDHPDDHQPGIDAPGGPAGQPGSAPRPDVCQGHGRGLRRDRRLRRGAGPGGQHRPGRGRLDRRAGRADRRAGSAGRSESRPTTARVRPAASEVGRLLAGTALARELWGWEPRYSLDQALDETIAWVRDNLDLFRVDAYAT